METKFIEYLSLIVFGIFAAIIGGTGYFIYWMVDNNVELSGSYSGGYRPRPFRPKG